MTFKGFLFPLAFLAALQAAPQARADAPPGTGSSPPTAQVPAPPSPPPAVTPSQPASPPAPAGQWVETSQYGRVWMPYDPRYTQVDEGAAAARMYVYTPVVGWHWVAAPWVLGIGPAPVWGAFGPVRFGWYTHPWPFARPWSWGPRGYAFRGRR